MARTRLYIKDGVSLDGLTAEGLRIVQAAIRVWSYYGLPKCTITSGTEGQHTASNSGHVVDFEGDRYYGFAIDLRTSSLPRTVLQRLVSLLAMDLGPAYDVVLESDHIHVEFDRRAFRGREVV